MTLTLATLATVRDEAPYIVDWIAHQRAIGIERIVICQNDSVDGTDRLLAALADEGVITYIDNTHGQPIKPKWADLPPQRRAYARGTKLAEIQTADYVLICDVDEYLDLPGGRTLPDLIASLGAPDVISLPWRNIGSSGQTTFDPAPVTTRFGMAAAPDAPSPVRSLRQVKSLYRPGVSRFYNLHKPRAFRAGVRWLSADGRDIRLEMEKTNTLESFDYSVANLRHYHVKTRPEFAVKIVRGFGCTDLANRGQLGRAMFDAFDTNDVHLPPDPATAARAAHFARQMRANLFVGAEEATAIARHRALIDLCHAAVEAHAGLRDVTLRYRYAHSLQDYFQQTVWSKMPA